MLRSLAAHGKIGCNNHSHEDDLWKGCGEGLTKRERRRLLSNLMARGVMGCKYITSAGGKGQVYWIEDAHRAATDYPELKAYLKK